MCVQKFERPFGVECYNCVGKRGNLAPLTKRAWSRCFDHRSIESQSLDCLAGFADRLTVLILPDARKTRNVPTSRRLRLHYRAGPEGVAAVKWQAVIEDM